MELPLGLTVRGRTINALIFYAIQQINYLYTNRLAVEEKKCEFWNLVVPVKDHIDQSARFIMEITAFVFRT